MKASRPGVRGETVVSPELKKTSRWALTIQHTWDGEAIGEDEAVSLTMELTDIELAVRIDAPFHDDPPPNSGELWTYEVVELLLVGVDDTYLEVELSPHGQHLVLFLRGERHVVHRGAALAYRATLDGGRWQGLARIPVGWLPVGMNRLNAFAMHGTKHSRRYLAWKPTGGPQPDFHRLAAFGTFADCLTDDRPSPNQG